MPTGIEPIRRPAPIQRPAALVSTVQAASKNKAKLFGVNDVGCFTIMTASLQEGRGAVLQINGADGKLLGSLPESMESPMVVVGFSSSQRERFSALTAFRDRVYLYAFGADSGELEVQFTAFLGRSNETALKALDEFYSKYAQGRVSVSKAQAVLSFGNGSGLRGPIIGMGARTADAEMGLHTFSISMIQLEVQRLQRNSGKGTPAASAAVGGTPPSPEQIAADLVLQQMSGTAIGNALRSLRGFK